MNAVERAMAMFHTAARSAALGRRLGDPVILLAAANLALRAGGKTAELPVQHKDKPLRADSQLKLADSRPDAAALRAEARANACGEPAPIDATALVEEIEASLPDPGVPLLTLARIRCPSGAMVTYALPYSCSMVCVASDGTPLLIETARGAVVASDEEAEPTLAFVRVPHGDGLAVLRLFNQTGRYAEGVVAWA